MLVERSRSLSGSRAFSFGRTRSISGSSGCPSSPADRALRWQAAMKTDARCARADFSACDAHSPRDAELVLVLSCTGSIYEAADGTGPTVEVWTRPAEDGMACVDVNVGNVRLTLEETTANDQCTTRFKVSRFTEAAGCVLVYQRTRREWLSDPDTPSSALADEESVTGDVEGGTALLKEAAALFDTEPAKLVDAMDVLPQQSMALEKLLAMCGDHLCS